jgi:nucleosome binding factor SPN SPT16 subunit
LPRWCFAYTLLTLCRYQNPKGEGIDVMYRNIRYAFFQPAENDMITILHFHLTNPIMIGNKKCKDVQFYCEVG